MHWHRDQYELTDDKAQVSLDAVHALLSKTYWAANRTEQQIATSIENSTCFSLFHDRTQVGFFRALSDSSVYTYLMDFVIHPDHQGKGLGSWALDIVLNYPSFKGTRFSLVTKDAQPFYARAGFVTHPYECMTRL